MPPNPRSPADAVEVAGVVEVAAVEPERPVPKSDEVPDAGVEVVVVVEAAVDEAASDPERPVPNRVLPVVVVLVCGAEVEALGKSPVLVVVGAAEDVGAFEPKDSNPGNVAGAADDVGSVPKVGAVVEVRPVEIEPAAVDGAAVDVWLVAIEGNKLEAVVVLVAV